MPHGNTTTVLACDAPTFAEENRARCVCFRFRTDGPN